ncbi:hypothetical protein [uncultured Desulfovibrio sp.]|uniref:hypothetical protein n=1 Tax=uncultured Desulfovibrio sp. TaxID=167968 RepID=UPI002604FFAD|nr:hypothetical protein [uncultured Desulfovibrio sp.]
MAEQAQEPQKTSSEQKPTVTTSNPGAASTKTTQPQQKGEPIGSTGKLTVFHS